MKQILLLYFYLTLISNISAQIRPGIINFSKADYQAQNQNWSLDQLPNEYVAIANSGGMLLYNGINWEQYQMPDQLTIRSIRSDNKGNVYVGAYGEFGRWSLDTNGKMTFTSLASLLPKGSLQNEEIWNIIIAERDIYFQSFGKIFRYSISQSKAWPINPPKSDGIMLLHEVNDHLYFQVLGGGVYELLPDDNFIKVEGTDFLSDKKVVFILPYNYKGLLIGTEKSGIYTIDQDGVSTWENQIYSELSSQNLNRAILLRDGSVAIGTTLNGVYFLTQTGRLIWHINRENGLQNNTVLSMMEDVSGNVWLGLDQGIDIVDIQSQLVYYNDTKGTLGTIYASLFFENNLYLGTNQGLFRKSWNGDLNAFSEEPFQMLEGSNGQVWSLKIIGDELYGMHNDFTFNIKEGKLNLLVEEGGWDLLPHPKNSDMLILSTYNGVSVLRKTGRDGWEYTQLEYPIGDIRKTMADQMGNFLSISSFNGLHWFVLDPVTAELISYNKLDESDGLVAADKPTYMYAYKDSLFIHGQEHVYRFDPGKVTLTRIKDKTRDITGRKYKFFPGAARDYFLISDQHIKLHRQYDTLSFNLSLVNQNENISPINGKYYLFCLEDGFALFDQGSSLKRFNNNTSSPPIVYSVIARGEETTHLKFPLDGSQQIEPEEFDSDVKNIEISFGQVQFTSSQLYRTRLNGYENEWTTLSSNNKREFNNLSRGEYQFDVQSQFSDQIGSFTFTIKPVWYQTNISILLFTVLIILMILLLFYLQRRHLKRMKRRLELQNQRRLHEQRLKEQNELLQKEVEKNIGELCNTTMLLAKKNQVLIEVKDEIKKIKSEIGPRLPDRNVRVINNLIDSHLTNDQDWTMFEANFNKVHDRFFKRLLNNYPDLTNSDLKLASYLKMNLTSKQIAQLLNVSHRSLENKRYSLRKKLGLTGKDNLVEFIIKNY